MKLEAEILTGARKGKTISLSFEGELENTVPYILETEAIKFILTSERDIYKPKLIVGNTKINLSASVNKNNVFIAYPERNEKGWLETLFFNYLGIAIFNLYVEENSLLSYKEIGRVEVLARAASTENVQSMIDFILNYDEGDLLKNKGPTRKSATIKNKEEKSPQQLIEQLEENLYLLEMQLPYIINAPLSTLSSKLYVQAVASSTDIGEQGTAWLAENLSVLEPTDNSDIAVLKHEGIYYSAEEVQTSIVYENKDIYENRIIHGYLDNLLRFTNKLLQGYTNTEQATLLNKHSGYVSFFSAMSEWIEKTNTVHIQHVQKLQNKIRLIQNALNKSIPIKEVDRSFPRLTPKVRANRRYTILFRSIHSWYQGARIDWGNKNLLLSINNIPKLFELYSVLLVKKWCSLNCTETNIDKEAFWSGVINKKRIKLHYEPDYWMSGHLKHVGDINNTQNRGLSGAINDSVGKVRNHKFQKRSPDIVLEVEESDDYYIVVLDAKYTTPKLSFERDLPECILKYVHGLGSWRTKSLVRAMLTIHPDSAGEYHDFHSSPYDIEGLYPQLPILGSQGITLSESATKEVEPVHQLLNKIFKVLESKLNENRTEQTEHPC